MKNRKRTAWVLAAGLLGASAVSAAFDGSEPLMCSFGQVVECLESASCRAVTNESVDAPDFVKLDFRRNQITSVSAGQDSPAAEMRVTSLVTHLIVQGVQGSGVGDSLGFSLSIDQTTGQMVAAGAGENAGFVVFGSCTAL